MLGYRMSPRQNVIQICPSERATQRLVGSTVLHGKEDHTSRSSVTFTTMRCTSEHDLGQGCS